jgi:hypothetical protein
VLHQLVILVYFQNKILQYVCVRMYCMLTLCNLCHELLSEWYVGVVLLCHWMLQFVITYKLSSTIFYSKFFVNRNKLRKIICINFQSNTAGRKLRLKTKIPVCLQPLERWSSHVCLTLRKATVSGNVELEVRKGECWREDNIKMKCG